MRVSETERVALEIGAGSTETVVVEFPRTFTTPDGERVLQGVLADSELMARILTLSDSAVRCVGRSPETSSRPVV